MEAMVGHSYLSLQVRVVLDDPLPYAVDVFLWGVVLAEAVKYMSGIVRRGSETGLLLNNRVGPYRCWGLRIIRSANLDCVSSVAATFDCIERLAFSCCVTAEQVIGDFVYNSNNLRSG